MAVASVVILAMLTSAVVLGPSSGACRSTKSILPRGSPRRRGSIRSAPTILGQDLLARMLYGGRISLAVGFRGHGRRHCRRQP